MINWHTLRNQLRDPKAVPGFDARDSLGGFPAYDPGFYRAAGEVDPNRTIRAKFL